MTDAALVRTFVEFRQQLKLAESGAPELPQASQIQIKEAQREIEAELRAREIDPGQLQPGSTAAYADGNVVRFVTLDEEG